MGNWLRWLKCPCCEGKGGYTEPILDFGIGPYYPCDFCNEYRKVTLWKWFVWQRDCVGIFRLIDKLKKLGK